MSSTSILQRLSGLFFPGAKLDRVTASKLAAELRRCATLLDDFQTGANGASNAHADPTDAIDKRSKKKVKRAFDFSRFQQRYVALELAYIGWDYQGFAAQGHDENTIEGHLFRCLKKICLIPEDATWEECKYSRCGRTDIGVSATNQTIALMVRSAAKNDGSSVPDVQSELDYPHLLNKVLPRDIRILGWTPVPQDFHARWSAQYREYKYYIAGARDLDLIAMNTAAKALEGVHDFSNLCRMNLDNSTQHVRSITHAEVCLAPDDEDLAVFTVRGKAFIWNQVRCMAAVLLMVGQRLEEPGIMQALLDIERVPGKPQYKLASEIPLLLHRTGFDIELNFVNSAAAAGPLLQTITSQKRDLRERLALVSAMHERVLQACARHDPATLRVDISHTPLLKRGSDPSFAERLLAHQHKRARVKDVAM